MVKHFLACVEFLDKRGQIDVRCDERIICTAMLQPRHYFNLNIAPVIHDLGIPVNNKGLVAVPETGYFYQAGKYLAPSNHHAGGLSVVDLLANHFMREHRKGVAEAYQRAVEYARENYVHGAPPAEYAEIEEIGQWFRLHRRLYEIFVFHRKLYPSPTIHQGALISSLTCKGENYNMSRDTVIALPEKAIAEICRIMDKMDQPVIIPSKAFMAVPYFNSPCELGGFALAKSYEELHKARFTPVNPSTIMFTGLPRKLPSERTLICKSPGAAMKLNADTPHYFFSGAKLWAAESAPTWLPVSDAVLLSQEKKDLAWCARACRKLNKQRVTTKICKQTFFPEKQGLSVEPLEELILREVLVDTKGDQGIGPDLIEILQAAGPSPELRIMITSALLKEGRYQALSNFTSRFSGGVIVSNERFEIKATTNGYFYKHRISSDSVQITNFIMKVTNQVIFPESEETHLLVDVTVNSRTKTFVIPSSSLETSKKLNTWLQSYPADEEGLLSAQILEFTTASKLLPYFRKEASDKPVIPGISFLGWDHTKDKFYGHDFHVDARGTCSDPAVWQPHIPGLSSFNSAQAVPEILDPDLPDQLCNVIGAALAMVHRHQCGHDIPSVDIRNTAHNREVVQTLFLALGQSKPVSMFRNARNSEMKTFRGYPFYTIGDPGKTARTGNNAAFILCGHGLDLEDVSLEQAEKGGGTLRFLLKRMVSSLVEGKPLVQEPALRICPVSALIEEGSIIARSAGELIKWPQPVSKYPALEALLRSIPLHKADQHFYHDFMQQKVMLSLRGAPKAVREAKMDILAEVLSLAPGTKLEGDFIVMDAVAASELFTQYYHTQVPYSIINTMEVDEAADG